MMDEIEWWEFDTTAELAEQAAGDIAFVIESAIEAHGEARLALAGGSTPEPIFKALAKTKGIDWAKVTLIPTDERIAAEGDALRNDAKLRAHFSKKGARIIPLVDDEGDAQAVGRAADARLADLRWPLDLVMLGMGADGHTASIFPGPDFDAAVAGPKGRRAIGVRPEPKPADAPVDRVTLTADAIGSARTVMLVLTGAAKRQVLERAIDEGPLTRYPVGRVLSGIDASVDIFWCPD